MNASNVILRLNMTYWDFKELQTEVEEEKEKGEKHSPRSRTSMQECKTQVPAAWCRVTVPWGSWKMNCLGEDAFSALQQVGPQMADGVWLNGQTLFSCPEDKG